MPTPAQLAHRYGFVFQLKARAYRHVDFIVDEVDGTIRGITLECGLVDSVPKIRVSRVLKRIE
jgi:hypothetical protein